MQHHPTQLYESGFRRRNASSLDADSVSSTTRIRIDDVAMQPPRKAIARRFEEDRLKGACFYDYRSCGHFVFGVDDALDFARRPVPHMTHSRMAVMNLEYAAKVSPLQSCGPLSSRNADLEGRP